MKYATCTACGKTMAKGHGCTFTHLLMEDGSIIPRIKNDRSDCHDCNVTSGQYHHPNCDMARCPICGGQESFCECPIKSYVIAG